MPAQPQVRTGIQGLPENAQGRRPLRAQASARLKLISSFTPTRDRSCQWHPMQKGYYTHVRAAFMFGAAASSRSRCISGTATPTPAGLLRIRLLPRREPGQPVMWLLEAWTVAAVHASVTGEFISGAGLDAVPIIRL